jgi:hypothetical protein
VANLQASFSIPCQGLQAHHQNMKSASTIPVKCIGPFVAPLGFEVISVPVQSVSNLYKGKIAMHFAEKQKTIGVWLLKQIPVYCA